MDSDEKKAKRSWTKVETLAFLEFYKSRQREFQNSRKKRLAYGKVLNDLMAGGYVDRKTTVQHLEVKMAALIRAYKISKDKSKRGEPPPCVAPFMDLMDEICSDMSFSNSQTLSCGAIDFDESQDVKPEYPLDSIEFVNFSPSEPDLNREDDTHLPPPPPPPLATSESQPCSSSCKLKNTDYLGKKLQHLEQSNREKTKRWMQYLKIQEEKAERHREKMDKLDAIINLLMKREC